MNHPFAPLSEDEIDELERFLLYEIDSDEAMTLEILDGYLFEKCAVDGEAFPPEVR